MLDGTGIYGSYMHYALLLFFTGSAFLMFARFWWMGRLDMDESPKFQMMEDEDVGR